MKFLTKILVAASLAALFAAKAEAQSMAADSVYMMAQKMPEYPGGRMALTKYLMDNIKMPQKCRDEKLIGMSVVEFVVEKDGTPSNFVVSISSADRYASDPEKAATAKLFDKEALRLAAGMQKWSIAEQDGKPVRARMRLPVKFTIGF